ncbi:MAG: aldo/keto reductase [Caulobacteraceae bacterium]|nr:aldo/keto reductase [Caulobacter sp.]
MRFRALRKGRSVSAVTLSLAHDLAPKAVAPLVAAALAAEINAFELTTPDPRLSAELGGALANVDPLRRFVMLRIGGVYDARGGARPRRDYSRAAVEGAVGEVRAAAGLDQIDMAWIDDPQPGEADGDSFAALEGLRASGRVGMIGVSGAGPLVEAAVATGRLDVLVATYNLRSGWPQRHRLTAALAAGMSVVGERYLPDMRGPSDEKPTGMLGGLFKRRAAPTPDAYGFLHRTPGWKADELCLGYALTEPALATVLVEARTPEDMARLAAVPERDLPVAVAAQVEMARFSGEHTPGATRT